MRHTPHPVSLRQLQYLVAVGETRSFHRAAELCRVSQPSLSAQVAEAENVLGVRVFERDRRRVLVTGAGAEVLRRAREILIAADDLMDGVARWGDPLGGKLRIGVIPTVAPYLLPRVAPRLRRAFPRLQIHWTEERTATLVKLLAAGELEAMLVALEAELGDVEHAEIAVDPFVLALPAHHPLARSKRRATTAELNGAELLVLAEGHCLRDQSLAACKRAHASPFGATSLGTLVQMVAGGDGLTLLPRLALPAENRRGLLRVREFAAPGPHRTLALAWRRGAPVAPALRGLAEAIRAAMP
jgi:LysR family hydrogen peroxide-inducible transcriptional activator